MTTPPPREPAADRTRKDPLAMNSTVKILVPLGLLIAVVFAITFFSMNTPSEDAPTRDLGVEGGGGKKPLIFFNATRRWDPASASLQDRAFTGYYEAGETQHTAAFWFENANPKPVTIRLKGVSCSACSGGRVAPIPPEALRALLQTTAVSVLPLGPIAASPPALAGASANLVAALKWQSHAFSEDPAAVSYSVPAAADADGWSPQWGILELNFKVRPNGRVPLTAGFTSVVEGTDQLALDMFNIFYEQTAPFELDKAAIEVGELTDSSAPQTHDLLVYSSARDQMADLTVLVSTAAGPGTDGGPFVAAGSPVQLSPADLERLATELSSRAQRPVRVRSAVRVPLTVAAKVGAVRADIGRLERIVWVAQGGEQKQLSVRGTVRGPVALADGKEIDLGAFRAATGGTTAVDVLTERPGMELAILTDQTRPRAMRVALERQADRGEKGCYRLRVSFGKDEQQGEITDGVVVVEVKGPVPQRFRIPVTGKGTR